MIHNFKLQIKKQAYRIRVEESKPEEERNYNKIKSLKFSISRYKEKSRKLKFKKLKGRYKK